MKMKRNRRLIGTVRSVAIEHGCLRTIQRAFGLKAEENEILRRVLRAPVVEGHLGRCAGFCDWPCEKWPDGLIELHYELKEKHVPEGEYVGTFLHEVGHLIHCFEEPDNKSSHGKAWKAVMARLGRPNEERCHNLDIGATIQLVCPHCFNRKPTRSTPKEIAERISHQRLCPHCHEGRLITEQELSIYREQHGGDVMAWPRDLLLRLTRDLDQRIEACRAR